MGQALNVDKQILADGRDDLLPRPLEQDRLDIGADHGDHQDARVDQHHIPQANKVEALLADQILDVSHQERCDDVIGDRDRHDGKDQQELLPVGSCIPQEAAQDDPVLHVAVKAHGLLLVLDQEEGDQKDSRQCADDPAD